MANDIHVWLSDEDAEALRARAKREVRSMTNMVTVLIRRGLADEEAADEGRPTRGRPAQPAPQPQSAPEPAATSTAPPGGSQPARHRTAQSDNPSQAT